MTLQTHPLLAALGQRLPNLQLRDAQMLVREFDILCRRNPGSPNRDGLAVRITSGQIAKLSAMLDAGQFDVGRPYLDAVDSIGSLPDRLGLNTGGDGNRRTRSSAERTARQIEEALAKLAQAAWAFDYLDAADIEAAVQLWLTVFPEDTGLITGLSEAA
ncbi:hypothetical protein [Arthrobacter mobilis]|uniref:Uncharacterized protein n=1 Tax=Arthrobacter mobilis TaxID=2724944 RepID=A0A7X6HGY7_9MICC|nr:hypothetical protein [Arthrobacter mobilis]NKX55968.1 hypothetical protein [Arthrobacter mobilis]